LQNLFLRGKAPAKTLPEPPLRAATLAGRYSIAGFSVERRTCAILEPGDFGQIPTACREGRLCLGLL
jgi:hypothetical protein